MSAFFASRSDDPDSHVWRKKVGEKPSVRIGMEDLVSFPLPPDSLSLNPSVSLLSRVLFDLLRWTSTQFNLLLLLPQMMIVIISFQNGVYYVFILFSTFVTNLVPLFVGFSLYIYRWLVVSLLENFCRTSKSRPLLQNYNTTVDRCSACFHSSSSFFFGAVFKNK